MITRRHFLATSGATLATAMLAQRSAVAQSWPNRHINLIVPLPPGGMIDFYGRAVAEGLSQRLGTQVVVENRSGADGRIGMARLARQPADGYSIGIVSQTNAIHPALFKEIPYDIEQDFQPLGLIGDSPLVLVVGPAAEGVNSVADLVAAARSKPGLVTFGSSGNGSPFHLASELLASEAKVQMLHVPYRGSAPLLQGLLTGDVWFAAVAVGPYLPYIASGRLRAIATTLSQGRSTVLPHIPTVNETLGEESVTMAPWIGLVAPAGVPPEIVDRYNQALRSIVTDNEFVKTKLEPQAHQPRVSTPAEMAEILKADVARYKRIVSQAHIVVE